MSWFVLIFIQFSGISFSSQSFWVSAFLVLPHVVIIRNIDIVLLSLSLSPPPPPHFPFVYFLFFPYVILFYFISACGHTSCFWCIHLAMNSLSESNCPICRKPYKYFPAICLLLHSLLWKLKPSDYKKQEEEVLSEFPKSN